uniref:Hyp22 n=1 Tax=Moniliophthora roreri (strain MCA 2997) TaxID=1381753 RepID=F2WVL3_MONRO|nr:hyp22 [Moniliophthora roreri]ADO51605.1 hyp22 [Moniliophthora roreri]
MYETINPYMKYLSLIGKIIQILINITFGGIIIYYNPIYDLYESLIKWIHSFNLLDITIVRNSVNRISLFLNNISNWLDSLLNKSNQDLEDLVINQDKFSNEEYINLRKSYNFNDLNSDIPKDSSNSDSDINWSKIGKYCLILSGIIIIGGLVYYNWDGILSHLGYIQKNNNLYETNSNQSLIDLSTPTNSNTNSPSSDQFIRYFKDPNLSSTNSSPISITSEVSEISNKTVSNCSTSSSITIKPDNMNVDLLSNKPEEIIIKTDSPEPKKILLRISEETLNKLREKGELSPLDKDITTQIEK